jgi:hypothetical protein
MPDRKKASKKGGFPLVPITLSEPVKTTDGFTNLIEDAPKESAQTTKDKTSETEPAAVKAEKTSRDIQKKESKQQKQSKPSAAAEEKGESRQKEIAHSNESVETAAETERLTEAELLRILGADSLDEIYELSDVLRASSLKLYAALVGLSDERGRVRVKNHELMSKAGIKGIATLYKQERWLSELKLVEKKAKPGPHDGSSYFVYGLETLPLPREIYDKFAEYLSGWK